MAGGSGSACHPRGILLLQAVGKVILLHTVLFPTLASDSTLMAHVDPSIIISTPFPLERLSLFVGLSLVLRLMMVTTTNTTTPKIAAAAACVVVVIWYTIIFYVILILCGISPTIATTCHTLLAACHVVVDITAELLKQPWKIVSPTKISFLDMVKQINAHLLGSFMGVVNFGEGSTTNNSRNNNVHQYYYYSMYGSIIGVIVSSILRILDTGLQIQRHPIPIILGYTYGSISALFVSILITNH